MPVIVKLKNVEAELISKEKELLGFVNSAMRARALQTLGELKRVTPVDTGRARNSWVLTKNPNEFSSGSTMHASILLEPVSPKTLETLYITNGVNYIDKLNAGSSKQAPARFVETTVLQYFDIAGLVYLEV